MAGLSRFANAEDSAPAAAKEEEVFNAYNRMRTFDNNEMDKGKPWVAKKHGNFDLNDPYDNRLAKMKMSNNLVGKRSYVAMMIRQIVAREELPGGLLVGGVALFSWQLQVPDPKEFPNLPEDSLIMRSLYTARYLDPHTMELVETMKNPFNGKMMKLEDAFFAENYISYPKGGTSFVEEPEFSNDDPDAPKPALIKRWGDELTMYTGGIYSNPGQHQPRFTETNWTCKYDDVMNPDKHLIDSRFNIMAVNKAFEKPWAGYTLDDKDLLCSHATGRKIHSVEEIPEFHKRLICERYPERL